MVWIALFLFLVFFFFFSFHFSFFFFGSVVRMHSRDILFLLADSISWTYVKTEIEFTSSYELLCAEDASIEIAPRDVSF